MSDAIHPLPTTLRLFSAFLLFFAAACASPDRSAELETARADSLEQARADRLERARIARRHQETRWQMDEFVAAGFVHRLDPDARACYVDAFAWSALDAARRQALTRLCADYFDALGARPARYADLFDAQSGSRLARVDSLGSVRLEGEAGEAP